MIKKLMIEIETDNMAPVYGTDDVSKQNKETEQLGFFEEQIVTGIKLWIKEQLRDEFLNEAILGGLIPDYEFQGVEGWIDLSQYGTIKITLEDGGDKEVLCFFQREKIPTDEVNEEVKEEYANQREVEIQESGKENNEETREEIEEAEDEEELY